MNKTTEGSSRPLPLLEKSIRVRDIHLAYVERGESFRGIGPTLLFAHATGFHARIWDKIIDGLGNFHSISVDMRGHGRSGKRRIQHWDELIADLTEFIPQLDLSNIIGIGHSMGAHALVGAAGRHQSRFLRLVAIDPVIPAENDFLDTDSPFSGGVEDHPTVNRRNEFDSPEQMAERLRSKGSFGLFHPDILMDYCTHGLMPNEKGKGYVLACPPDVEAGIYMSSRSNHSIYEAVHSLVIPVLILRAKEPAADRNLMDFSSSPTWPGLVGEFQQGREIFFPDKSHFLPMQIPDKVTKIIADEINAEARQ